MKLDLIFYLLWNRQEPLSYPQIGLDGGFFRLKLTEQGEKKILRNAKTVYGHLLFILRRCDSRCGLALLASLTVPAYADEAANTTTITTEVPSTYELTIPATVDIAYGEQNATIGSVKVQGRITEDQYVKVTASTDTNFCLVNESDPSKKISYRPEDIFASKVNGSVPIFRGKDFTASEVNGNGGSCLVVARINEYAWSHAAAGKYSDTIVFTASLETNTAATQSAETADAEPTITEEPAAEVEEPATEEPAAAQETPVTEETVSAE